MPGFIVPVTRLFFLTEGRAIDSPRVEAQYTSHFLFYKRSLALKIIVQSRQPVPLDRLICSVVRDSALDVHRDSRSESPWHAEKPAWPNLPGGKLLFLETAGTAN